MPFDCVHKKGDCIQLCLVDELTNCTLNLLANDRCDAACDNVFCAPYSNENFLTPDPDTRNGTVYAADSYQCPFNGSVVTDDECSQSSAQSVYLDPNVPAQDYSLCESTWIGDGLCDDRYLTV